MMGIGGKSDNYSLSDRPGWLRLTCDAETLDDRTSPTFVGRRQRHFKCRAAAFLDFEPEVDEQEAGLTAFMNDRHHYEIAVTRRTGQRQIIVRRRIGSLQQIVAQAPIPSGPVELAIEADRDWYTLRCAVPGEPSIALARGETRYLSSEVGGMFTGVYLAMYATGAGLPGSAKAYFDWFNYRDLSEDGP
ncbi:MAG: hypothetical protein U9R25_06470 [Chloroflexota bacterium]|nr:hypothetical protein [Chloroflexota bacterium]